MSSFATPLSGLTASTDALDIVGNNLANLNTTGYKDSTVSFYDLLSQSIGGEPFRSAAAFPQRTARASSIKDPSSRLAARSTRPSKATDCSSFRTTVATSCIRAPEISNWMQKAIWSPAMVNSYKAGAV